MPANILPNGELLEALRLYHHLHAVGAGGSGQCSKSRKGDKMTRDGKEETTCTLFTKDISIHTRIQRKLLHFTR